MNEEKSVETTMPARMSMRTASLPRLAFWQMRYARPTAAMPNVKAFTCTKRYGSDKRMASAAPNPAPELAPRMSGETIGFLKSPW